MMHLAVYSANFEPEALNCSLVECMFESLISYCQKNMERGMRLIVMLGCQEKLAFSVYQFAPGSCQDAWGGRDFGLIEEALSLDHCFGESCFFSICKTGFILQTHYFSKPVLFALVFSSKPIEDQYSG